MSVDVVVYGATGKTGELVREAAELDSRYRYVAGVSGSGGGDTVSAEEAGSVVEGADVVVDFSTPSGAVSAASKAREAGTALVEATTGLDEEAEDALEDAAEEVPVVYSSNYAVGVNVFWRLVEELAEAYPDGDFEVTETHHREKVDAPSGTAETTVERIQRAVGDRPVVYGREGESPRGDEIAVHSLRAGDVVGEHEVLVADEQESLSITHTASSRRAFAEGALDAAEWLVEQDAGLYSMDDVLEG